MASSRYKQLTSKQNSRLTEELITHITKFKKDNPQDVENFEIARNYVESALYKRSFLDILPADVWNKVNRITERFQNHAEHRKAKLWTLLTAAVRSKITASNETAITSVLFVLMQVANLRRKLSSDQNFERILEVSECSSTGSVFDDEVDPRYSACEDSSDSSVSSSDSEESNENRCLISVDSGAGNSPDVELEPPFLPHDDDDEKEVEEVDFEFDHSFSDFWQDGIIKPYWILWEERQKYVTEQALMTEIVWMLQGNKEVFLFQWNGKNFYLREGTRLIDVDQDMIHSMCTEVCKCAQYIVEIEEFIEQYTALNKPKVFQAFALVLKHSLSQVKLGLMSLESDITDEVNPLTLLLLLDKLRPALSLVTHLWNVLQSGVVQRPPVALSASSQAMHLLHSLYKEVIREDSVHGHNSLKLPVLVNIFLETCQPFLNFIDRLLTEGQIDDPHYEFVIERLEEGRKQNCDEILIFREIPIQYREGFFLYDVLQEVVLASCLTVMLKESYRLDLDLDAPNVSLAAQFMSQCRTALNLSSPTSEKTSTHGTVFVPAKRTGCVMDIQDFLSKFDPLLKANFESIFPLVPSVAKMKHESLVVQEPIMIRQCNKPLNLLLEEILSSLVSAKCEHIHKKVIEVLKDDLCIQDHLQVIRRVFLFENGYSLNTFTKGIVHRMIKNRPWTSTKLVNMIFSELVTESNLKYGNLLSVAVNMEKINPASEDTLDELISLCINYSAPSPVNLILNNESMTIYQNIFCFLMKLNCAKSSLEMLRFYDLCNPDSDASVTTQQSMYMFKLRLLHLVNRLQFYFLSGLLESRQVLFGVSLDSVSNFHQILCLHQEHLKDLQLFCLLSPSCVLLNSIICHILSLVLAFSKTWNYQTLISGMKKIVVLENDFYGYIWTFNRTFSLLRSEQATKLGLKNVQFSDFMNLANIFSCQMNIPRPHISVPPDNAT